MPATKLDETVSPGGKRTARPQVSFLVSPGMKAQIDRVAQEKGCSFGHAVEQIIELYFAYKQTLDDIRETVATVGAAKEKAVETVLFHNLWTPVSIMTRDGRDRLWAPPRIKFPIELEKIT